jgi:hypothetical protein
MVVLGHYTRAHSRVKSTISKLPLHVEAIPRPHPRRETSKHGWQLKEIVRILQRGGQYIGRIGVVDCVSSRLWPSWYCPARRPQDSWTPTHGMSNRNRLQGSVESAKRLASSVRGLGSIAASWCNPLDFLSITKHGLQGRKTLVAPSLATGKRNDAWRVLPHVIPCAATPGGAARRIGHSRPTSSEEMDIMTRDLHQVDL